MGAMGVMGAMGIGAIGAIGGITQGCMEGTKAYQARQVCRYFSGKKNGESFTMLKNQQGCSCFFCDL